MKVLMRFAVQATPRMLAFLGFLVCSGLLAFALYLQYYEGLEPCPLCMLQRLFFVGVALILLIATVIGPARIGMSILAVLAFATSVAGAVFAARHVWLQLHPPELPECTADLFYQLKRFPILSVIERALRAVGDCATIDWTFLGLSIPGWSLVWFVLLAIGSIALLMRAQRVNVAKS